MVHHWALSYAAQQLVKLFVNIPLRKVDISSEYLHDECIFSINVTNNNILQCKMDCEQNWSHELSHIHPSFLEGSDTMY